MKFALCIRGGEGEWVKIDQEVEADSLVQALSRISDRYRPDNIAYIELPVDIEVGVTGFSPQHKIQAIKEIRDLAGLGLKESKDIVDAIDQGSNFVPLGRYTLDQARTILRQRFVSLRVGPNPKTTDSGILAVLNLQGALGGSNV